MTPEQMKCWRADLGISQREAAVRLGLGKSTIELYERGYRLEDNRPVIIPLTVALACSAIACNLSPWPITPKKNDG